MIRLGQAAGRAKSGIGEGCVAVNEVRMTVFDNERQVFSAVVTLPLELGRQREADSGVFRVQDLGQLYRIAIAPTDALGLSREAVRVEPVDRQSVRLRNIHRSFP